MTRAIFTIISATGRAETFFKAVTFNISTRSNGQDSAAARVDSDRVLNEVIREIKRLNEDEGAGIDESSLKCTYSTSPWQEHNRLTGDPENKGYRVDGSVVCTTEQVDKATVIMDALTKIADATVGQPQFTPDESYDTRLAAYRDAVTRAREKLALQCEALGLDPKGYEAVSLPTEEHYREPVMARAAAMMAESPAAPPAEIRAGTAEVSVTIRIAFAKKKSTVKPAKPRARTTGNGKPKAASRAST